MGKKKFIRCDSTVWEEISIKVSLIISNSFVICYAFHFDITLVFKCLL